MESFSIDLAWEDKKKIKSYVVNIILENRTKGSGVEEQGLRCQRPSQVWIFIILKSQDQTIP